VFLNICKHRAARLVNNPIGNLQEIICPYHGWKYKLDGRLSEVTEEKLAAPDLCKEKITLTELPFMVEAGLIWVVLPSSTKSLSSSQLLKQHFAPLTQEFEALKFNDYTPIDSFILTGNFNWKIAVESFLEIYHFSYLHGKSITNQTYQNIALFDKIDQHCRITIPMNSFIEQLTETYESKLLPHSNIMYFIFPCHFILLMRNFFAFIAIMPLAINKCQIEVRIFVPANNQDIELEIRAKQSLQGLKYIMSEDISVCESVQQNIETNTVKNFNYTKFEAMINHFHLTLREKISLNRT
jgi:phenylpropionate dioxygenase-like ring-hydroxylating dioxygenase large terminal subunit